MSTSECEFHLGPSRLYVWFSVAVHAGAALALVLSRVDMLVAAPVAMILLAGFFHDSRTTGARRGAAAVTTLRVRGRQWSLTRADGRTLGPVALHAAWVFGNVVLLRLGTRPWRRVSVVVPRDALSDDAFRQLRCAVGSALRAAPAP